LTSQNHAEVLFKWFEDETRPLVASGVEVLIPTGGGPMALLSGLRRVDGAPVIDGTAISVKAAEMAVKLRRLTGLTVSRVSEFRLAPPEVIEGWRPNAHAAARTPPTTPPPGMVAQVSSALHVRPAPAVLALTMPVR
jgi:hypothetical protein